MKMELEHSAWQDSGRIYLKHIRLHLKTVCTMQPHKLCLASPTTLLRVEGKHLPAKANDHTYKYPLLR